MIQNLTSLLSGGVPGLASSPSARLTPLPGAGSVSPPWPVATIAALLSGSILKIALFVTKRSNPNGEV